MIKYIQDAETVARWIMHSSSKFKVELLRGWLNHQLQCVQFIEKNVPVGWALFFYTDDFFVFVSYFTAHPGYLRKSLEKFEEFIKDFKGVRFQTERLGPGWPRLYPGLKPKYMIMEKEF